MAIKYNYQFKSASNSELKANKILLQNIIFNTSEKKLMVSDKFLNDMTIKYISKRIKEINTLISYMQSTKQPERFFTFRFKIENILDDLIKIEPYFIFKKPTPIAFKREFMDSLPDTISHFISKTWKSITTKYPINGPVDPENFIHYDVFIESILMYRENLTMNDTLIVESYYKVVHGESYSSAHSQKNQAELIDDILDEEELMPPSGEFSEDVLSQ